MMQFIFFALSTIMLIAGHALFWYIFIKLFHITAVQQQVLVAAVIFGLFLSAVVSSYISHKWDNIVTRTYYIFSGVWIGFFMNLCLMALLVLATKYTGRLFGWYMPYDTIKIIFFGGAALLSAFGIYRVWMPVITEYEVAIRDLPEAWDGKTIVQLSDVHLGPVYQKKFFSRLIKKINDLKPEALFITGDLFDGTEAEFAWLNHPFTKLNVPKGIYYGFGNHDLYLGFNRVIALLKENPVEILDNKMVIVDGLQIIGVNYSFNSGFNLEEEILKQVNYSRTKPSILLLHAPRNIELAKRAGIDMQLSGHTHDGQLWPFNYLIQWAHHGYGYGFFQEGDFSLVVNSGAGTWGPPMRTAARSEIVKIVLRRKQ